MHFDDSVVYIYISNCSPARPRRTRERERERKRKRIRKLNWLRDAAAHRCDRDWNQFQFYYKALVRKWACTGSERAPKQVVRTGNMSSHRLQGVHEVHR